MTGYEAKKSVGCVQLVEAFSLIGVEEKELVSAAVVQQKLEGLGGSERRFIESQIKEFLQNYGKRRYMEAGIERTKFILGKIGFRPTYYVWVKPGGVRKYLPRKHEDTKKGQKKWPLPMGRPRRKKLKRLKKVMDSVPARE